MAKKIILTQEQIDGILSIYNVSKSTNKVIETYHYSNRFIAKVLRENNVSLRKPHEMNRKHDVNEDFFDSIDTEEKAYFLGFLFSDGNVHTKYNTIALKLQLIDREILERLSILIMNKVHLYDSQKRNDCTLRFSSLNIKNKLIALGCVPNKSLKLKFPDIDPKLYSHFIRGYFDGDGSIIHGKRNDFKANITSTENFCKRTMEIISGSINLDGRISKDKVMLSHGNDITSTLIYAGNRRVEKVLDWLYVGATIYLERKHKKYLELKHVITEVDKNHPSGRYALSA